MFETTLDFKVGNETCKTWSKVIGDLKSGIRSLVTLHGGPRMSQIYTISHTSIYPDTTYGIPVIFYDQLGIVAPSRLPEGQRSGQSPGVEDDFYLLGHSWGGTHAADYTFTRHAKQVPEDFQDILREHEKEGTTLSKEYQDGAQVLYNRRTCKVIPLPEELVASFKMMEDHLREGPQGFFVAPFIGRIPKVKWIKFAKSHRPFWEGGEYYFKMIGDFLLARAAPCSIASMLIWYRWI
ncbi:hypothetical protein PAXRUDRAFT_34318 [Paxillus rubicundulus Ve08.2h10]|uniref:AB hydrolase-1 domain-containing protein n=1 Tax=Paxillus rubicundulus Ve08.2h10 TaxID=930991 RepID=A0A0D0E013_9AGAM|nr:hypothetical protein PAXRUDRAFT_34318 [Paxillus rubicundulus Ve08.2h10]